MNKSSSSLAKKKKLKKRILLKNEDKKINQNLGILSDGMKIITEKLKEVDAEFAEAHLIVEKFKSKYLFDRRKHDSSEDSEEKKQFDRAFEIVIEKTFTMIGNALEKDPLKTIPS